MQIATYTTNVFKAIVGGMKGLAPLGERRSDFYLLGSLVIQRRRQRRRRHRRRRRRRR